MYFIGSRLNESYSFIVIETIVDFFNLFYLFRSVHGVITLFLERLLAFWPVLP